VQFQVGGYVLFVGQEFLLLWKIALVREWLSRNTSRSTSRSIFRRMWLPAETRMGVHVVCSKYFIILGIFFALFLGGNSCASQGTQTLEVAYTYITVREKTNKNDAPEIDKFLKYVGLAPHFPYCLAFANYCWGQAAKPNPYPRIGGTVRFMEIVKAHPLRYRIYIADDFRHGINARATGGIGIYFHGPRSGHAVLFAKQIDFHTFSTVEGNTVGVESKNTAEQRGEGKTNNKQGVYKRIRSNKSSTGMQFQGIVVPR
jgi:hypothetical protein